MSVPNQEPEKIIITSRILAEIERRLGCAIEYALDSPINLLDTIRSYIDMFMQGTAKQEVISRLDRMTSTGGQLEVYVQFPVEEHMILGSNVLGYNSQPTHRVTLTIQPAS